ncbi:glycosyltransferase [Oryzobacter terrae]|uniref:glycosyltransferase n=1 Tax=Oryzobacter terrae TaxID=1620385 RepID=UPI00366B4248
MTTVLDVVVPVHDEEAVLAASVHRLHAHLVETFPYPFRITVADNASTDRTWEVATHLVATLPGVTAVRLKQKGRGRALARVWNESDALVLAYMDVDLSTDLDALWPLVAPLMSGHSDVAIGSRLHRASRVVRGARREVISRGYNLLLRATLGARFSDAQCGFKAIRADVARELLPLVEDTTWFFDTELLVLAERSGLRIHEVPVDWYDDPDSRVALASTARDDLRGIWRVGTALARHRLPVDAIAERIGRGPAEAPRTMGGELAVFAVIGVVSTVLHLGGFVLLRQTMDAAPANAVALLVAAVVNTWANRRWTFRVRGRSGVWRQQVQGLLVLALTLAMTTAGLDLLHAALPLAATWVETGVVAVTAAVATAVKFLAMKVWVFAPTSLRGPTAREAAAQRASRPTAEEEVEGLEQPVAQVARVEAAIVTTGPRSRSRR